MDEALVPPSSSRNKGKARSKDELRTEEGDLVIKDIMEEFMANLGKGAIDTNVFASGVSRSHVHMR